MPTGGVISRRATPIFPPNAGGSWLVVDRLATISKFLTERPNKVTHREAKSPSREARLALPPRSCENRPMNFAYRIFGCALGLSFAGYGCGGAASSNAYSQGSVGGGGTNGGGSAIGGSVAR